MSPIVEQALLHFIYRDTLMDIEELSVPCLSLLPLLSESLPTTLLAAAENYGLPRLKLLGKVVLYL